jgi:hypothetical protein
MGESGEGFGDVMGSQDGFKLLRRDIRIRNRSTLKQLCAELAVGVRVFGRSLYSGFWVRATIINTSIVASIPLVLARLTADVPYSKLVNLGNVGLGGVTQLASSDVGIFLVGLQHSLIVLSLLILGSAIFSFLRGLRVESDDPISRQA